MDSDTRDLFTDMLESLRIHQQEIQLLAKGYGELSNHLHQIMSDNLELMVRLIVLERHNKEDK
jgi:hypothetical protein